MTSVVCSRYQLGADSLANDGGTRSRVNKIHVIKGDIVACAGCWDSGLRFVEWYKDKRKTKPEVEDFSALVLTSDNKIVLWGDALVPNYLEEYYWAIGSGRDYALGAIAMGATVKEAVEVAIKLDVYSGGPVKVVDLSK